MGFIDNLQVDNVQLAAYYAYSVRIFSAVFVKINLTVSHFFQRFFLSSNEHMLLCILYISENIYFKNKFLGNIQSIVNARLAPALGNY